MIQGDWKLVSRMDLDPDGSVSQEEQVPIDFGPTHAACSSAENYAIFNLAEDPYEQHPYLYDADDMTSSLANKHDELVGRLRELSLSAYQTGRGLLQSAHQTAYVHPKEVESAPLEAACSAASNASSSISPRVFLEAATSGVRPQCSADRRGATAEECSAAVREAASRDGLEVAGFKSVSDGAESVVPAGCSYSVQSKTAMFNTNSAGGTIWHGSAQGKYRLACVDQNWPFKYGAVK
jgi:hypothetical protein